MNTLTNLSRLILESVVVRLVSASRPGGHHWAEWQGIWKAHETHLPETLV